MKTKLDRRSVLKGMSASLGTSLLAGCGVKDEDSSAGSDTGGPLGGGDSRSSQGDSGGADSRLGDSGQDSAGPRDSAGPGDSARDSGEGADSGQDSGLPADSCTPSEEQGAGPYYREGSPYREDLDLYEEEGQRIRIYGQVTDEACQPLPGVEIEIWHADRGGLYDNESKEMRYRAVLVTDKEGRYEFWTLKPPGYGEDKMERPPHIHFRFLQEGERRLTSQIYFAGEELNTEDYGWVASLEVTLNEKGKMAEGQMDWVLPDPPVKP